METPPPLPKMETPPPPPPAAEAASASSNPINELPLDQEELENNAAKSYGLAAGTTNTYIIDGMEEMSPEEYRAKLQETISARQAQRRKSSLSRNSGIIGNKSSSGYLDGLSRNNNQG
mmetsp:Transcript_17020/g.22045  ORF Transcript_17020/g.22045 Transcript_17020/m.22045 type:complete len:118 (+) Transcript_17020:1-354(+)